MDHIRKADFWHFAARTPIPGSEREDLQTAWGYGGPIASDAKALVAGLSDWNARQQRAGRVAELVRLHPFLNPVPLSEYFDLLAFNRTTVLVDLQKKGGGRWAGYSDSTRNCIRSAQKILQVRELEAAEWPLFMELYHSGLELNRSMADYFFDEEYFRQLAAKDWCRIWVAEDDQGAVAVSCFLHAGGPLCHYHLAGGNARARAKRASYALLESAFAHFSEIGCRWMHLGGGRSTSADDSLLTFKAKFSPIRMPFYIGGIVHDRVAYNRFGGGQGRFLCAGLSSDQEVPVQSVVGRVSIRPIRLPDDLFDFFRLRSDLENIRVAGFDQPPSWTKLAEWLAGELSGGKRRIYLIEEDAKVVGYLYALLCTHSTETSIGVEQKNSGRGIGRVALAELLTILANDPVSRPPYTAWIREDNVASIRAHEAAGFVRNSAAEPRPVFLPTEDRHVMLGCWRLPQ